MPNYPHPVPDPLAAQYSKPKPTGFDVDQLPNLTTLAPNLQTWLHEVDPTINMRGLDPNQPGAVMILANGEDTPGRPNFTRAKVLNGEVPNATYHGVNTTWKATNQKWLDVRKAAFSQSSADYYHVDKMNDLVGYSQDRFHGGTMSGFTDKDAKKIFINAHSDRGDMLVHEYFHTADPGDPSDLGWGMDEGMVDFFARDAAVRWNYPYRGNGAYEGGYQVVKRIVDAIGLKVIVKLWFNRSPDSTGILGGITNKIAEYVKPSEEAHFNERLPSIEPLIEEFCAKAKQIFPLDIVLPPPIPVVVANAPAKKTWAVNVPNKPFRSGW